MSLLPSPPMTKQSNSEHRKEEPFVQEVVLSGEVIDLDNLTTAQRAVVALDLMPEILEEVAERVQQRRRGRPKSETGKAATKAASLVGIGKTSVETALAIQKRNPAIVERMRTGELNVAQAARAVGLTGRGGRWTDGLVLDGMRDAAGRTVPSTYYGKGDKWKEAVSPILRYLTAWERRNFEYRHVNPREARRRLALIEEVQEKLDAAAADLRQRAHSATLRVPTKKG